MPGRRRLLEASVPIVLAALVASLPRLVRGVSCGHDFDFHLVSWLETRRSWSEGVLYPNWAQSPNWGAGEPRFVFYPPLTWMLGALLSYATNWDYVAGVLTFVLVAATGFATRALARQFLPSRSATVAGALAAVTPYGLFTAYERTALGELAAAIWIPMLLLFALRRAQASRMLASEGTTGSATRPRSLSGHWALVDPWSVAGVSVCLALTWLTNAPAAVMASYLLAFAALTAALILRAWWPVTRAAAGAAIGLGLAAFYIVPAAYEQRWIAIHQALDVGMRVSDSWLFSRHGGSDMELHDRVLMFASILCLLTTAMALAGLLISLKRRQLAPDNRHVWLTLVLLVPGIFLLQLPFSAPLWHLLPKLEFLQFPWRWLMVLATPYAILLGAATPLGTRRARIASPLLWSIVLLIFAGMASLFFFQYCDEEDEVNNQFQIFTNGTGSEGTDEYAPTGADNSVVASGLPAACLVTDPDQALGQLDPDAAPMWYPEQGSCDDTYGAQLWQNEHKILDLDSEGDGFVIVRLRRYPAWQVTVNGVSLAKLVADLPAPLPLRDDGLMVIPIQDGHSTIDIRWSTTPDVVWGRWISAVSFFVLVVLGSWGWRRRGQAALVYHERNDC